MKNTENLLFSKLSIVGDLLLALLDYAIVFLFIVATGCMWAYDGTMNISIGDFFDILIKLLILFCIFSFLLRKKLCIGNKYLCILVGVCVIAYAIVNEYNNDAFIMRFAFLLGWMILWFMFHSDKTQVWKRFTDVVVIIAIISLFYYVFASLLRIIPETCLIDREYGVWKPDQLKNFQYLYYEGHYLKFHGSIIWRNCAFFAEAPKAAVIFCMALASELTMFEKKSKWRIIILSIAALSTLSTRCVLFIIFTGVLWVFLFGTSYPIINRIKEYMLKHRLLFAITIVATVTVVMATKYLSPNGVGSMNTRIDHIKGCLNVIVRQTMFGCGWYNNNAVWQYVEHKQGLAAGILPFIAFGGIVLGSTIFIPFIHNCIDEIKNKKYNYLIFDALLMFLVMTGVPQPVFQIFIAWMVTENICSNQNSFFEFNKSENAHSES